MMKMKSWSGKHYSNYVGIDTGEVGYFNFNLSFCLVHPYINFNLDILGLFIAILLTTERFTDDRSESQS